MLLPNPFRSMARLFRSPPRRPVRRSDRVRPKLETLEARDVPSITWTALTNPSLNSQGGGNDDVAYRRASLGSGNGGHGGHSSGGGIRNGTVVVDGYPGRATGVGYYDGILTENGGVFSPGP